MATQVDMMESAPGAIEQFEQLIKRFGLIAAGLLRLEVLIGSTLGGVGLVAAGVAAARIVRSG